MEWAYLALLVAIAFLLVVIAKQMEALGELLIQMRNQLVVVMRETSSTAFNTNELNKAAEKFMDKKKAAG